MLAQITVKVAINQAIPTYLQLVSTGGYPSYMNSPVKFASMGDITGRSVGIKIGPVEE